MEVTIRSRSQTIKFPLKEKREPRLTLKLLHSRLLGSSILEGLIDLARSAVISHGKIWGDPPMAGWFGVWNNG